MALKGKQIAEKAPVSKRKRNDSEKSGARKRKNPGVLQFFDVAADVDEDEEESDNDDFDQDFMDKVSAGPKEKNELGKSYNLPFLPKEEDLSDEELERLLEERYKPGSQHVVYADDEYDTKGSGDKPPLMRSTDDPTIWRVKCKVGRERHTTFCLIQKYVDLQSLGSKLKIISAFAPDHTKGYIYIEAERECDVLEACKGLSTIYSSRILPVPKNQVANLFSVRNTSYEIPPGTWVRMKYGNYRGDLAQAVAFDDARKKATVKLIPRINLQALAKKLASGGVVKQTTVPAPRVISSRELEEFRPHIQLRRDRQTGKIFETIDGLMLKDGYLYKRVSIESLSYSDVVASADEIQKFKTCKKDASDDVEWLSHLYGEQRKKRLSECSKGTTKGSEGTSGTKSGNGFQLHDLIFFGPKDFGVIIGVENDSFQVIKGAEVEGAEVLNVELHEIKNSSFDKKFTTMDQQMKIISISDTVRVLEGPFKGKQGVVRHICRGTIFIYDENQLENGGYFCAKSQSCENINSNKSHHENIEDGLGPPSFEDSMICPKSPQLSKKPWEAKEFDSRRQGDRDESFSIGQTLRIRVGPLKGHLCRVVAIYRSEVTVKVDSKMKVMTVKREHLSEAGVKSIRGSESSFTKPYDGFGTLGEASGAPAESNGWNSTSLATGRSSWPDFPASDFLLDSSLKNPFDSAVTTDDPEKGKENGDDPWETKATSKIATNSWGNAIGFSGDQKSSWTNTISEDNTFAAKQDGCDDKLDKGKGVAGNDEGGWGNLAAMQGKEKGDDPWGTKAIPMKSTSSWGNATVLGGDPGKEEGEDPWGTKATPMKSTSSWGNATVLGGDQKSSWSNTIPEEKTSDAKHDFGDNCWDKGKSVAGNEETGWGNSSGSKPDCWKSATDGSGHWTGGWGTSGGNSTKSEAACNDQAGSWNNQSSKKNETISWDKGKGVSGNNEKDWGSAALTQEDSWGKAASSWKAKDGSNGNKADCWSKGKMGMEEASGDREQQDDWNRGRTFDGGRGSGGRRGRGGFRGGNRDHSGRGRSFGRGRSSGFNNDDHENRQNGTERSFAKASSGWNNDQSDSWNKNKGCGGSRLSSWNNQENNWNASDAFAGNQSSGWNKESATKEVAGGSGGQENGWKSVTNEAGGNQSSSWDGKAKGWKDGAGDEGGNKPSGWGSGNDWGTPKGSCDKKSANWSKGFTANEEAGGSKDGDGWNRSGGKASSWRSGAGDEAGNKSSGWGTGNNWNTPNDSCSNQSLNKGFNANEEADGNKGQGHVLNRSSGGRGSSWRSGAGDEGGSKSSVWGSGNNWNTRKGSSEKQSSNWKKGFTANQNEETDGNKDQGDGWKSGVCDGGKKSSGWGSGNNWNTPKGTCGNESTDWNKGCTVNEEAGGNKDQGDGWNRPSDGNQRTGWGSRVNDIGGRGEGATGWGSGNAFGGDQSSSWNKGANTGDGSEDQSNWKRREFGNRDNASNWRGGNSFGRGRSGRGRGGPPDNDSSEAADSLNQSRGFGRGGSNRGGFGRGDSNRGGFGRGDSNRGGFGRGGSNRGGFGNRGRGRRDQPGDWNREKSNQEDQSFSWNKGATDDTGGWRSNGAESWNQGGSEKGHWNSWNKEAGSTKVTAGGTSNLSGGWGSQGTKDAGGTSNGSGGWVKEIDSTKEAGVKNEQVGGWNNKGSSGNPTNSWNQPNNGTSWDKNLGAKEETSGGKAVNTWGKGTGSSWGTGKDGSGGQGGW